MQDLLSHLSGMLCRCLPDTERTLMEVHSGGLSLLGYEHHTILDPQKHRLAPHIHPDDLSTVRRTIASAVQSKSRYTLEFRLITQNGRHKWVHERGLALCDDQGAVYIEAYLEDVSDRVQLQLQLIETERHYRSMFENSVVGMFESTENGRYLAANQALADLYGYATPDDLVNCLADIGISLYVDPKRRRDFKNTIQRHGKVVDFESEVYRRDGSRIWIAENAHAVHNSDGSIRYYQGTVEDITERRRYQATLQYQATHDPLTGLPNRNVLAGHLQDAIAYAQQDDSHIAVAFVDLDNFKIINDSLGHAVGDTLLVEVARRLRATLPASDTVARYGGDEFVLIIRDNEEASHSQQLLQQLLDNIQAPLELGGHALNVNGSIGVARYPDDAYELDNLLRLADVAMYDAKAGGKGLYRYYTQDLNQAVHDRFVLQSALQHAIENQEFTILYQAKVDQHGQLHGFEALVRWDSPEHGRVNPARFIPLAEETGQILAIGAHTLKQACCTAAAWPRVQGRLLTLAVNLSVRQLRDPRLIEHIRHGLYVSGLKPEQLELEITESMIMDDVEQTIETLDAIKALGVRVAVDDFGTGYSSLSYLQRLPIDTLKIDRSFVTGCHRGGPAMVIPHAVIFLGRSLNLHIVAEGVEQQEEFETLAECGCDQFQGYLFSSPLNAQQACQFIAQQLGPLASRRDSACLH